MQSFTLAQIERAIYHWRNQNDHAHLYHDGFDGMREQRLLSELYGRLVRQRLGAIDADEISNAELSALGCLFDVPTENQER